MPSSLRYPLERERDVQRRWRRLLQRTITPTRSPVDKDASAVGLASCLAYPALRGMTPPRDRKDDNEEKEEREPTIIKEPDEDE